MPEGLVDATPKQLEVLRAYLDTGSIKAAAAKLHIKHNAASQRLQALYRRTGARNVAHAAYLLGLERPPD